MIIKDIILEWLKQKEVVARRDVSFAYFSYGKEFPDERFFLVQKNHICAGIMEDYVNFLLVIDFALSRGMIPVIDRLNFPAIFQQEEEDWGKINGWEVYFEQPIKDIDLEYIKKASNVTICNHHITFEILEVQSMDASRFMEMFISKDPDKLYYAKHLKYIAQKYIRFNVNTLNKLNNILNITFQNISCEDRILGVSIREETILRNEPTGKLSLENIYDMIEKYMLKWNCNYCFIASEFGERIDKFIEKIGKDKVLYVDRKRPYNKNDPDEKRILELATDFSSLERCKKIIELQEKVFGPKKERWLGYLGEIWCLVHCSSALLQVSSGNIGALLMKENNYDNVEILK